MLIRAKCVSRKFKKIPQPLPLSKLCRHIIIFTALFLSESALAQSKTESSEIKIGRGKRTIQRQLCQVPVTGEGLAEGDLAEVIDKSNSRVAVVKLERLKPKGRLVATVIVGEDKCSSLRGLAVRTLSSEGSASSSGGSGGADIGRSLLFVSPRFQVSQTALPGMALNKFLSPGYSQRGFGFNGVGVFPRNSIVTGPLKLNFKSEIRWSQATTSPLIDLVRDGKVIGTQGISTQNLNLRVGAKINYLNSQAWTGAGLVLLDKFQTSSKLASIPGVEGSDQVFQVIRDVSGSGLGLFGEQGFIINNSAIMSVGGGFGLGSKISTPIVEDGEATNTSDLAKVEGLPLYLEARVTVPFLKWIFVEMSVDYKRFAFSLPLINEGISKAQYDAVSFSTGVGFRY